MAFDATNWLIERAYELDSDRDVIVRVMDRFGKKKPVDLYSAGLRRDVCGYISRDEYVLIIDLLDGRTIIYDGYHNCFQDYIPGTRLRIDEDREAPIFSTNLKHIMKNRKISDRTLAAELNISIKTIEKFMCGKWLPSCKQMVDICDFLKCDITDLTLKH